MKLSLSTPILAVVCMPGLALSETPAPATDPRAIEIAQSAADFLVSQERFSFNWFVSVDEVIDGREKVTEFRSGRNLVDRAHGFVSETENREGFRDYYFDGETFTIASPADNTFASAEFIGEIDALAAAAQAYTGSTVPLWSLMSPSLGERMTEGVLSGAYLGETVIAGRPVHHLAFSEYDSDWQLWVDTDPDRPLIVMLIGTDPYTQGWPQYRAYLSNWDFAPETGPEVFTFAPDENDTPIAMPDLVPPAAAEEASAGDTPAASE